MKNTKTSGHTCTNCNKTFTASAFNSHSCVINSMNGDAVARLKRLLKSGGCGQDYYNERMLELTGK